MCHKTALFSLLFLSLSITTPVSHSHSFTNLQTLHSLSHSIMVRVANLRSARGDDAGAERAWLIASKLDRARSGFWSSTIRLGWDYLRNYAWTGVSSFELLAIVSDLNELMRSLNELTRMSAEDERMEWGTENYRDALRACNSLFRRLLKAFHRSGPLRQLVKTVQKEVVEGDLLRDCIELGSNDFNGLIKIMKDVALQFSSDSDTSDL